MNGRLRVGDVCMAVNHAGDCFSNFILLESVSNAVRGIPESRFGAYKMNPAGRVDVKIPEGIVDRLARGEWVWLEEWKGGFKFGKDLIVRVA